MVNKFYLGCTQFLPKKYLFRVYLGQISFAVKVFKKWDKTILDKHKKVTNPPKGYHRIKVHLVFAVKFDGRHKARFVVDGHLSPEPMENMKMQSR